MTTIPKEKDVFAFASRNYNFRSSTQICP